MDDEDKQYDDSPEEVDELGAHGFHSEDEADEALPSPIKDEFEEEERF